jgi:hypothetical protein
MEIFDPTIGHDREPIAYAPRPRKLERLRVGLVENTKFNSDVLLLKIAERLKARHGMDMVKLARKKSASATVYESDIAEFKDKADFVIAGIGD